MIKVIVFDYGGVIKIHQGNLIGDICDYLNISREEWRNEYFKFNHLSNINGLSYKDLFIKVASKFAKEQDFKDKIIKMMEFDNNNILLNIELLNLIKDLKSKNYKIALLSNNSIELRQRLMDDGIFDLFNEIIVSAEVGYQKPEPEIFEILFSKMKVKPEEVIFIDDSKKSLENADKIGYIPILFRDNNQLKNDLNKILNSPLEKS